MLTGLPTGPPPWAMPLNANRIHNHGYRSGPSTAVQCRWPMLTHASAAASEVRTCRQLFVLGVCVCDRHAAGSIDTIWVPCTYSMRVEPNAANGVRG